MASSEPADAAIAAGRQRWLLAGQHLLRTGGVPAVKLAALVERTGLTTGSFYHHFGSMAAFLDGLASFYGAERATELLDRITATDPLERLADLTRLARDEQMRPLDEAMRDWAGTNDLAAAAVRESDELLLEFMADAFVDLGHGEDDARARAVLLLSVGVARVEAPWPLPPGVGDRMLEVLVRRPSASDPT